MLFLLQKLISGATSFHFLLALRCAPDFYLVLSDLSDFGELKFRLSNLPFSKLSI